jgi:hypothetical protein
MFHEPAPSRFMRLPHSGTAYLESVASGNHLIPSCLTGPVSFGAVSRHLRSRARFLTQTDRADGIRRRAFGAASRKEVR